MKQVFKNMGVALLGLAVLTACSGLQPNKYLQKDAAVFDLRLEQGACFGECPVFNLNIKSNGDAVLEAIRFLPKQGIYAQTLPQMEIDSLKLMLRETNFFALDSAYDNPGLTDLPTTIVTVTVGEDEKKQSKEVLARWETPERFNKLLGFLNRSRVRNF